jgi:hypothetical protein
VSSLTDFSDIDQFTEFNHFFVFYMISLFDVDYRVRIALWHDLVLEIQKYYVIVIDSFQIWCMFNNQTSWSATLKNLEKWAINRMHEFTLSKQKKNKMTIIQEYLSDIRSYHIDHLYELNVFDHSRLQEVLRERKRMFSITKATRLLIIKNILQSITHLVVFTINDLNFDTACKIAWIEFLRLDEITYISTNQKRIIFNIIKTIRFNVFFAKND